MENEKGAAFKKAIERLRSIKLKAPSFASPGGSRLSVNSLAKLSSRLENFSKGDGLKKTAHIVSTVICAYFIADLLALTFEKYLNPPPPSPLASRARGAKFTSMMDYESIISRNLFASKEPSKESGAIDYNAEPVPTTLPLQLVGTVIFQDPNKSLGAIQDKDDKRLYPVRVGDEIEGKAQILSVEPRRVVFINPIARRKEMVELPEEPGHKMNTFSSAPKFSAGVTQVEENNFVVKRGEIDSQLANWNTLIQQALAVPEMQGGQMMGFRLRQVQPGSFYEKLGIKQDDLITTVNGEKLTDVAKAAQLLSDLKNMNSLSLGINRKGKDTTLSYDIQ